MEKNYFLEHRMKTAGEYEASGRYLHSLQIYKGILEENPAYAPAVIKTAEVYRKTGKGELAASVLREFLLEYPEEREVRFYLCEYLLNDKQWEEADEVLSYFEPEKEPLASFFSGYARYMVKDFELARHNFERFVSLSSQGDLIFEAYFLLAKIEIAMQRFDTAIPLLKKADPGLNLNWEYNYLSALSYYNIGMHAHAASHIDKAVKVNQGEAVQYNLAGKIYLKLCDYMKAERYFRKYIDAKENIEADTYAFLGEACLQNSKTEEALSYFEKALAADPGNARAIEGKKTASSGGKKDKVSDG